MTRLAPHRLAYLDAEGPVSRGRGAVTIHSRGTYALDGDRLRLIGGPSEGKYRLTGEKLLEADGDAI